MAKRKPPIELEIEVESSPGRSKFVEWNPDDAPEPQSFQVRTQKVDVAGTLSIGPALIAAKEALKKSMGGAPAIKAARAFSATPRPSGLGNIVGWALGEKKTGGGFTGDPCVIVYVRKKLPRNRLEGAAEIPAEIQGYPTDIVEVGVIRAHSFTGPEKPVRGGASIGHVNVTAGTFGCLVQLDNDKLCILSNNHILANENDAEIGDTIQQPGRIDADNAGISGKRIATLERFVRIRPDRFDNEIDAAVAWTSSKVASAKHHCFNISSDPVEPDLHLPVRKCGRETEHTFGDIIAVGADVPVLYPTLGEVHFINQVQIAGRDGPFSAGGDSGALVVTAGSKQPVALLHSGDSSSTWATPISSVMERLRIAAIVSPD